MENFSVFDTRLDVMWTGWHKNLSKNIDKFLKKRDTYMWLWVHKQLQVLPEELVYMIAKDYLLK